MSVAPPEHVLVAFAGSGGRPEPLGGTSGRSYLVGELVLRPVSDPVEAAWMAGLTDSLRVPGVRIARPVRSTDGRWVVGGWVAQRFVSGQPAARFPEMVQTALALSRACADVPEPRFWRSREDCADSAEGLAWGEPDATDGLGDGHAAAVLAALVAGRQPITAPAQVVFTRLTGHVLFAGSAPPAVVDYTASFRPAPWSAALVVVDAIAFGEAPIDLAVGFEDVPQWWQFVRRALILRLAAALVQHDAQPSALIGLLSTAELLEPSLR